jgi:hypothetical protein
MCTFPLLVSFYPSDSKTGQNLPSLLSTVYCFGQLVFLGIAQLQVGKVSRLLSGVVCVAEQAVKPNQSNTMVTPPAHCDIHLDHLPTPSAPSAVPYITIYPSSTTHNSLLPQSIDLVLPISCFGPRFLMGIIRNPSGSKRSRWCRSPHIPCSSDSGCRRGIRR